MVTALAVGWQSSGKPSVMHVYLSTLALRPLVVDQEPACEGTVEPASPSVSAVNGDFNASEARHEEDKVKPAQLGRTS